MMSHIPVLLAECKEILAPKAGESVLDVTLGLGGHSRMFLEETSPSGVLVGIDADEVNMRVAAENLAPFGSRAVLVHANFGELPECLPADHQVFDVILADLGLSSPHIDDSRRGFMFREDAPLDMRFDQSKGMTAAMLLASTDRNKLLTYFTVYGELPYAHTFTDALVTNRSVMQIQTSSDLVQIARDVYRHKADQYLPQIFQALRIAVNDEMGVLEHFLTIAPRLLHPNGRLGIISYHSLEDRLVKQAFKQLSEAPKDPVTGADLHAPEFTVLTKKAISAEKEELSRNPRARSAKFRAIVRSSGYTSRRS
jgi:16S rRNA (cytosine1402-N4)-methyltransferase